MSSYLQMRIRNRFLVVVFGDICVLRHVILALFYVSSISGSPLASRAFTEVFAKNVLRSILQLFTVGMRLWAGFACWIDARP